MVVEITGIAEPILMPTIHLWGASVCWWSAILLGQLWTGGSFWQWSFDHLILSLDPDMGLDMGLDLDTDLDLDKPQWMWGDTHGRGGDPSWLCADQCAWAPHYVLGVAPWPC